jgi:hypothetical protein
LQDPQEVFSAVRPCYVARHHEGDVDERPLGPPMRCRLYSRSVCLGYVCAEVAVARYRGRDGNEMPLDPHALLPCCHVVCPGGYVGADQDRRCLTAM